MTRLAIVHLSDFHIRTTNDYVEGSTLDSLIRDVKGELRDYRPDNTFVAVSGDLTFSGTKDEFSLVSRFIGNLKSSIQPSGILLSPGNHDLHWEDHKKWTANKMVMEQLMNKAPNCIGYAEQLFENPKDRDAIYAGMGNYYSFLSSGEISQSFDRDSLYSISSFEVEKFKINFLSLNSAYLFNENYPYYGYIGASQIEHATSKTTDGLKEDFRTFNVAIFHHPLEAIPEIDAVNTENSIKKYFNVVLTGHTHNMRIQTDYSHHSSDRKAGDHYRFMPTVLSSARCVFDEHEGFSTIPGYAIIELEFFEDYVASISVLEKQLTRDKNWVRVQEIQNPSRVYIPAGVQPEIITLESDLYNVGKQITNSKFHSNLVVFQRTPSLILGEQPYCKDKKPDDETAFVNALNSKIKECLRKDADVSLIYLFSRDETRRVLQQYPCLSGTVKDNIDRLKGVELDSGRRFVVDLFHYISAEPFIIADDSLMVCIGKGPREMLFLSSDNFSKSESFFKTLKFLVKKEENSADKLFEELGLNRGE